MKEKKTEVMTIRVPLKTKQGIEKEAEKRDWSSSKLAEKILTAWLEETHETDINIQFNQNNIHNINIK